MSAMEIYVPVISASAFVAEGAMIRGEVSVGERASIWFNAVLRGDEGAVLVGEASNIQDCCVLHSDLGNAVDIGAQVTVGHGAVIRGARVADRVMIGMNSTVMTGALVGEGSIVGAGSFVPYGMRIPAHSMVYGAPAKIVRPLTEAEKQHYRIACDKYLELAEQYRAGVWAKPTD